MSEPTGKYSITMPRDIAEAARARRGPSGLSGYVAAAVARQIERDNLNELIAVAEAEHGPVTEEEVRARREELRRARTIKATPGPGSRDPGFRHSGGHACAGQRRTGEGGPAGAGGHPVAGTGTG